MKLQSKILGSLLFAEATQAFFNPCTTIRMVHPDSTTVAKMGPRQSDDTVSSSQMSPLEKVDGIQRRQALRLLVGGTMTLPLSALAEQEAPNTFLQEYSDFQMTDEGWSFREVKAGDGPSANWGDRVVFDWSGYTIGYFGRPFEAKGGPQGGAFDKDLDYARTELGSGQVVKGLECAMKTMKPGAIRQVLVPYGALGYPAEDASHDRVGPKPSTFSGQRALNFVLENQRVDRTLLFNVKLVRIDKPDGKGGFVRGDKRA